MTDDLETRIAVEDFQRHFVLTHMKNDAEAVFAHLKQEAEKSGAPFGTLLAEWIKSSYPQAAFRDDNWFVRKISLDACYIAHTDFRGYPVPKNQRFVDFMTTKRGEIERGTFPCSSEIRTEWSGPMPEPLAQERDTGRYFILDGQLRVIRHWFHNVSSVRVFVYKGQKDV